MSSPQVLRVVLLGKTGTGKSSTGNTLLGREVFRSESGFSSVTFRCQWACDDRFGTRLEVTDTPGVSDTDRKEEEVLKEVAKSVGVASPGPHVILMMLRCDMRFTKEEYGAYMVLKRLFSDNIHSYMIVVFAGVGDLGKPHERERLLAEKIKNAPATLREVLDDAGGRYCSVDNKASRAERDQQAQTILNAIQRLVAQNGNRYFSSKLFEEVSQQVETAVQQQMRTSGRAVTHEVAVREIKQDIVADKAEPGFFSKLLKTVGDAVIHAIKEVAAAAVQKAGEVALKRCSVM